MKVTKKVEVRDQEDTEKILLKGEIEYDSYLYSERIKKYQEIMSGVNLTETATIDDDLILAGRYFEMMKEKVTKVDVKIIDEDITINNVEDLYEYAEGVAIGNEIAQQIISSQKLGKQKLK